MKHAFSKLATGMLTLALLIALSPFALAEGDVPGIIVDTLIPANEQLLTESYTQLFDSEEMTISTDKFTTESGFMSFDFDKTQIQLAGAESYRTYTFTNDLYFRMAVAVLCGAVDSFDGLSYGLRMDWVENGQTDAMTQEDVHAIAGQLEAFFASFQ